MSEIREVDVELTESVTKLAEAVDNLNEVMTVFFDTFKDRGVQPSVHLVKARERVQVRLADTKQRASFASNQLGQLQQLVRTSALITSSLEIDSVVDEVMDTIVRLTGAERAYLMLYDDSRNLTVRAARNWEQSNLSDSDVGISRTVVNAAIAQGSAIITTNAQADERFQGNSSVVFQALRSIVCIPLSISGKIAGVLYADNRLQKGIFTEEIIPILTAFGTQAAIAITNAQLFGQVREDLENAKQVIKELKIEIDKDQVGRQVTQITDNSYFRELVEAAKELRRRHGS